MSRLIRIVLVFACMAVIVAVGLNGAAWADKVQGDGQVAGAVGEAAVAKQRPAGTVPTTPQCIRTVLAGRFTVGSVAEWILENVAQGMLYEACVVKPYELPARLPGVPLTYPLQLIVHGDPHMTVEHTVCFPVPPGRIAEAYYWDGETETWVKAAEEPKDGKACVKVPADAQAPSYVGLVEAP